VPSRAKPAGRIRVGIGGWTFAPWRETFYPAGLPAKRQLEYASRRLTALEINGTFYRTQTRATFRKWAAETPEDFVFTVKGPRYVVGRPNLAERAPDIAGFLASGLAELGPKLGPILWQLPPTKRFAEAEIAAFLALLPAELDGLRLRHALEVRNTTFVDPRFVALMRDAGAAIVFADDDTYPAIADVTTDFVYARLMRTVEAEPTGYPPPVLDRWADVARDWAAGATPDYLPRADTAVRAAAAPRDVFVFFISGAKQRAPAAAEAVLKRLEA
jgi:uncharacterized protein YecE (DUF72 family)